MKFDIKYFVMDVDGTLTDGKIYMGNDGEMFKAFDIKDGYGIRNILPQNSIIPIVITARNSKIVENRCKELGITHYYQGCRDKKFLLSKLLKEENIPIDNGKFKGTVYVGDDLIDLECMSICEFAACPADAVDEVKKYCIYISKKNGGDGAVREIIEYFVKT